LHTFEHFYKKKFNSIQFVAFPILKLEDKAKDLLDFKTFLEGFKLQVSKATCISSLSKDTIRKRVSGSHLPKYVSVIML